MKIYFYQILLLVFLLPAALLSAQNNWYNKPSNDIQKKWTASEISYQVHDDNANTVNSDSSASLINAVYFVYRTFISDVDGDNCPFHPTCSSFFVQSVKTTNIFQSILMTADRLTRDLNVVKNHYTLSHDGYLIDPVENYTLNRTRINLISESE